jgi:hypothetical protein
MFHLAIHGVERCLQHNSADGGGAACQQVKIRHHVTRDAGAQRVSPNDDLKREPKNFLCDIYKKNTYQPVGLQQPRPPPALPKKFIRHVPTSSYHLFRTAHTFLQVLNLHKKYTLLTSNTDNFPYNGVYA